MTMHDLQPLEVFYGEVSTAAARVYAQLPRDALPAVNGASLAAQAEQMVHPGGGVTLGDTRLSGRVVGPFSQFARTLPATVSLVDVGPGHTLLAEALIPDPCFWSPEEPFLYEFEVELWSGPQCIASTRRWLGIRPLGVLERQLRYAGRNWVLRGVGTPPGLEPSEDFAPQMASVPWLPIPAWRAETDAAAPDLSPWRENGAAIVALLPSDRLCQAASEQGVLVVARVSATASDLFEQVARLRRWPAVGILLVEDVPDGPRQPDLPTTKELGTALRAVARNMVFLQRVSDGDALPSGSAYSALAVDVQDAAAFQRRAAESNRCLIAVGQNNLPAENLPDWVTEARAACDRLQAAVAGPRHIAGYLVL